MVPPPNPHPPTQDRKEMLTQSVTGVSVVSIIIAGVTTPLRSKPQSALWVPRASVVTKLPTRSACRLRTAHCSRYYTF